MYNMVLHISMENVEHNILVSICCLTYNHEKYIRDALDGFLIQKTNFKYEVIIHDDASTDATPDIIREYAEKYPSIIKPILQKENQYSKGIRIVKTYIVPKVRGKYVAICEGDDYWCSSEKLQKQVDFLESHSQYSACVHNTKCVNCLNGKIKLQSPLTDNKILGTEDVLRYKWNVFHLSSVMYRRKYIVRPEAFYAKGFGDYPLAIYLSMAGKIYYFKDVMSVYRYISSKDSWTYKNMLSKNYEERLVNNVLEENRMLKEIDQYSEGKYHSIIYNVQRKNEFKILNIEGKYKEAHVKYRDIVRQLPSGELLKFMAKVYVPFIGKLYKCIGYLTRVLSAKVRKNHLKEIT